MGFVPSKIGQLNRLALLNRLQQAGSASRAGLAKSLELSQPTVGRIADELLRWGIVEELEGRSGGGARSGTRSKAGRPGRVLSLNRSRRRFLGIHLDVRETRFSMMPACPRAADQWDLVLPTPGTPREWRSLLGEASSRLHSDDLLGVILCVPGIVDESAGRILFSPNLHWTEKARLSDALREFWSQPIVMIQELHALALGHRLLQRGDEDFLAVDLGDGVGSASVVSGRLYSSRSPVSGELGHTPVRGNTRRCGCGGIGCVETLISRSGLFRSWAEASPEATRDLPDLSRHVQDNGVPDWLIDTLEAAGAVVAGALNVMGLRRLIVSGVLNELPQAVQERFASAVSQGALWGRFGEISCTFAPRHHTAGMVAVGLDRLVAPATREMSPTVTSHEAARPLTPSSG